MPRPAARRALPFGGKDPAAAPRRPARPLLAAELARRCTHSAQRERRRGETDADVLRRATHLHLSTRGLGPAVAAGEEERAALASCLALRVVYLQDNRLETLGGLAPVAPRLEHLCADRNRLETLEGLGGAVRLRRLQADDNRLAALAGLAGCLSLEDLSLRNQALPPRAEAASAAEKDGAAAAGFGFEDATVETLAGSLKRLSLAGTPVRSVGPLARLARLEELDLSQCAVDDLDELLGVLASLPRLRELRVRGCPVAAGKKFRDAVIVASPSLRVLDGAEITDRQRDFVTRLEMRRRREGTPSSTPTPTRERKQQPRPRREGAGPAGGGGKGHARRASSTSSAASTASRRARRAAPAAAVEGAAGNFFGVNGTGL